MHLNSVSRVYKKEERTESPEEGTAIKLIDKYHIEFHYPKEELYNTDFRERHVKRISIFPKLNDELVEKIKEELEVKN